VAYFARPEITITGDTAIDFDARAAHELTVKTDRPSVAKASQFTFTRMWDGIWVHSGSVTTGWNITDVYADIQGKPQNGMWEFGGNSRRFAPPIESMNVVGGAPPCTRPPRS
jgi:hypothetical protein